MHKIKIQQFEGPLDLLLQLIEARELDVSTVSLADVTEQYLSLLSEVSNRNPDELADFLVVAAKLLLIKSRILLPELIGNEEDGSDLESQLKLFREYYEASKTIQRLIRKHRFTFSRERPAVAIERVFSPPSGMTSDTLRRLFLGVLEEIEPIVSLPREVAARAISLQEKIEQIRQTILERATVNFQLLLKTATSKVEVIVTFLALLELVKQRIVIVVQEELFEDIVVKSASGLPDRQASEQRSAAS